MGRPRDRTAERDVYLKFFTNDWRGDEKLRNCSLAARGLWIELLCIAHRSGGYVLIAGVAPTIKELARQVGSTPQEIVRLIAELTKHNVCSTNIEGVLYSRRMVKDLNQRERSRANGLGGGNPGLTQNPRFSDKAIDPEATVQSPEKNSGADAPAPTRALMSLFDELHRERTGTRAIFNGAKDASLLARLHKQRMGETPDAEGLIRAFFQSDDPFIQRAGYSVGVMISQAPKLIAPARRFQARPVVDWHDECKQTCGGTCSTAYLHNLLKDGNATKRRKESA